MAWWNRKKPEPEIKKRRYDAGSSAKRMQGWIAPNSDANMAAWSLPKIRNRSRDLVRNNAHAARIVQCIASHTVGYGIVGTVKNNDALENAWKKWSESTECDASGRHDFYGLQRLIMRCVVESGECLIRIRPRFASDNLTVPMQLQVLEPDYLDDTKNQALSNGGAIISGIELDGIGRTVAYHIHNRHPGANFGLTFESSRVDAKNIIHVMREDRAGQLRGIPWLSPIMVKLRDLDEFQDGTLMRQKIANMFAGFVYDETPYDAMADISDGLKEADDELPDLQPGTVFALKNGRKIEFSEPPKPDSGEYVRETLRDIAVGVGITYEELTGDMSQVNFSSARMGFNAMLRNVDQWQWNILIPIFCEQVGAAFIENAKALINTKNATFEWTPPARTLVDPTREIPAILKAIRGGLMSLPEALRAQGYNPSKVLKEYAESNQLLDELKLTLDSDPRVDLLKKQGASNDTTQNQ
jgi:lambda family phage portal protein